MKFSAQTDRGRVRPSNEDAYCLEVLDEGAERALLAVADGMGGHAAGEVASALAIATLRERVLAQALRWNGDDERLQGLGEAIVAAHAAILAAQGEDPRRAGMGTTLTAVLIWGEYLYIGHTGDSRAYLVGAEGGIRQLTDDHSVVGELVRGGSLTELEAMQHPQRHLLTSALGTQGRLRVDLQATLWHPGDVVILCSDGLTNLVTAAEIAERVRLIAVDQFDSLARELVDLANSRGGHDNITVVAARRGEEVRA
ncbi:MAG: Stp1/IreP family PP2C-type Ser/Thr phosphatase [Bacillota bacterium]|nr:MAG: Stp1/IreP family PP2C-type Ser/Thr phosphatase [Bacillota bacterium]